jgi:oligopeptide/dipeptide ABC transporter ATP-binding protein
MAPLLELRGLTVDLPGLRGRVRPVKDVSLRIEPGETLAIVGESGSGKSILSLALMGLAPAGAEIQGEAWLSVRRAPAAREASEEQRVNLLAAPPREMRALRGRELAIIFQEPMTALNPVMRVGAQIEEAIRVHAEGSEKRGIHARAIETLRQCSVPQPELRARQYPHQLSGGLRQRALAAMAIAARPRLLIADEPTTALDATVQNQILEMLARLRDEMGLALIFITHDLAVASRVSDRIAVMYAGVIVEEGQKADVLRKPLHPYTAGLLRAAPRLDGRKAAPIPGIVPSLAHLPPGCAFEPRCEFSREECTKMLPEFRGETGNGHHGHRARCVLVP